MEVQPNSDRAEFTFLVIVWYATFVNESRLDAGHRLQMTSFHHSSQTQETPVSSLSCAVMSLQSGIVDHALHDIFL